MLPPLSGRWVKRWYTCTWLHDATAQESAIFVFNRRENTKHCFYDHNGILPFVIKHFCYVQLGKQLTPSKNVHRKGSNTRTIDCDARALCYTWHPSVNICFLAYSKAVTKHMCLIASSVKVKQRKWNSVGQETVIVWILGKWSLCVLPVDYSNCHTSHVLHSN